MTIANWAEFEARRRQPPSDEVINKVCARLFTSGDGFEFLKWLRAETKERAYGPDASDAALRHLEGQRQLCARIEGMIQRGLAAMAPQSSSPSGG